jgi:hypothetical protein
MIATPEYRAHQEAPAEDTYVLVDRSGVVLDVAVRCEEGERLPELAVAGYSPAGYIRVGEIETTAETK